MRSLQNILTRLRGTNFCISSERFAPSFVRQHNSPKCIQMVRNTPKHEFRVQWGGLGAFVVKTSDETSWHKLFATKAPDPPHWTINSCFGASRSFLVNFGLFRYCTKLSTKRAELVQLMQKFLPRSRIRIFHNERTRPTPLDHKLMFWCVS